MRKPFAGKIGFGSATKIFLYSILTIIALYTLIPLVMMGLTASRSLEEIYYRGPFTLPSKFIIFENLIEAWTRGRFGIYTKNSVIMTVPTLLIGVSLATFAGYAFAKIPFKGRSALFYFILVGMMIPFQAIMIPLYFLLHDLYLLGTYWGVILTIAAGTLPFSIFMMRAFFMTLPVELVEAAKIDGCSEIQAFWYVMRPLASPAVVSLIIFQSMWTWNNFIVPFLFINDESMNPIPTGLYLFHSRWSMNYSLVASGVLISAIPLFMLFIFLQRRFIEGLTMGAIKG